MVLSRKIGKSFLDFQALVPSRGVLRQVRSTSFRLRAYPKTVGDWLNFAESTEQIVPVPLS
jgi:hypothetical protein